MPDIPKAVDSNLQAALAKDPADSPADIEAWATRLAGELEGASSPRAGRNVSLLERARTRCGSAGLDNPDTLPSDAGDGWIALAPG